MRDCKPLRNESELVKEQLRWVFEREVLHERRALSAQDCTLS
jgi:hypothetical protein